MTQNERILDLLKQGYPLTSVFTVKWCNCYRLSARIYDLRRKGWNIKTEKVRLPSQPNGGMYAVYTLDKNPRHW